MRGFAEQVLHYFDRPTGGRPDGSVGGPAAWTGDTVGDGWSDALTPEQVEELCAAVGSVLASGADLGGLSADDVPLPSFIADVERWRRELTEGRGFLLVQGFPVERWTLAEAEAACWIVGLLLGEPGAQNLEGDLLGHVRDVGPELAHADERLYRTNQAIRFHCDAADVVGLLCRSTSTTGGASRLVSSVAVHDILQAEQPEYAAHLFDEFSLDTRRPPDQGLPVVPVTPAAYDGSRLRTFMHLDYFTSVERHDGIELPALTRDTLAAWEEVAERPGVHLDMQLAPGDLQLVSNHVVVHARTSYDDDPSSPRDLLRLWLSLDA